MQLVLALTGLYDGGAACDIDVGAPGFAWAPLVRRLQVQWSHAIGMASSPPGEMGAASFCRSSLALALGSSPPGSLHSGSAPTLPQAWLSPASPLAAALPTYHAWRTEPMRQAFGLPPSPAQPAYTYVQRAGTITCELLSQNAYYFTHAARAALEALAWQRAQALGSSSSSSGSESVVEYLVEACSSVEGAAVLLQEVVLATAEVVA